MQCEAPIAHVLQPNERWYLYDPLACAWQLIRDGQPTPDIYQGPSHLYVPQTAPAPRIPLPASGSVDTWWSIPTADPIPTDGDDEPGPPAVPGVGWLQAHPYLALGGAAAVVWLVAGGAKRRR